MRGVDIPKWLQALPQAPEFRPTETEFADPIAYISKIEKEASVFGICKVIPPLPKPSKKYVLNNLNKTLSKCPELGSDVDVKKLSDGNKAVFTTRQQELGQIAKKGKGKGTVAPAGAVRQVWQSGEVYTLDQFEAKSKAFAKSQLGVVKEVPPLFVETMFWKAASDKPIYIEYANDVPGSGFGEPEGTFRYFNRRRRRTRTRGTFDRNKQGNTCSQDDPVDNSSSVVNGSFVDKGEDVNKFDLEKSQVGASTSSIMSPEILSEGKTPDANSDMQGTAGWKLANSSWNLQVIARSPGSLTRFMPDDIPGVTSPMVYIGMLFSWFAWHVEDHELHSLNFLHMGSSKTWYSVPGDFASSFEEVIRVHAYGGSTNSIDALTHLGEKTTLISPEVIVASGIPCCRLVQNPGEFVVTFPRAYHVGFSHGFNCGEAANFSTPNWLTVAKEAAIRRAAMNYLPMLSHQQLMYLLTMSFVARIPRSLLPGARSSRLKDRQKEKRELAVKKSFVEDILKENHLLTMFLEKNPSCRVVLWDLNLLATPNKDTSLCSQTDICEPRTEENSPRENAVDLYAQMSMYMENATDFDLEDANDLRSEYQVDSGALPCVGCGILGFPFMAVVQPSRDLQPGSWGFSPQIGVCGPVGSAAWELNVRPGISASVASGGQQVSSWNLSHGFCRPRLFCLEHAIQTVDMLHMKGGANVLGICHSDFRKIKAHSAVVAEEVSIPFTYNEVPLGTASREDLHLIDHAIGNPEKDECGSDWSSELNVNMHHCANMRKKFPSLKVDHALTLDGLFPEEAHSVHKIKWQSRKSRSKRCLTPKMPSLSAQTEKVEKATVKLGGEGACEEGRVCIQYYRRRYRSKPRGLEGVSKVESDGKDRDMFDNDLAGVENAGNFSVSTVKPLTQSDVNAAVSRLEDSTIDDQVEAPTVDGHSRKSSSEKHTEAKWDSTVQDFQKITDILGVEKAAEKNDTVNYGNSGSPLHYSSDFNENSEVTREKMGPLSSTCNLIARDESAKQFYVQSEEDVRMVDVRSPTYENEHIEARVVNDECQMIDELRLESGEVLIGVQAAEEEAISCNSQLLEEAEIPVEMPTKIKQQESIGQPSASIDSKESDDLTSMCNLIERDESAKQCNVLSEEDVRVVDVPSPTYENEHLDARIVDDECRIIDELRLESGEVLIEVQAAEEEAISCNSQLSEETEIPEEMATKSKQQENIGQASSSIESREPDDLTNMCNLIERDDSAEQCNVQSEEDVCMLDVPSPTHENEHLEATFVDDECRMSDELAGHLAVNGMSGVQSTEVEAVSCDAQLSEEAEISKEIHAKSKQRENTAQATSSESKESDESISAEAPIQPTEKSRGKRKRVDLQISNPNKLLGSFTKSPCEGLRPRAKSNNEPIVTEKEAKQARKPSNGLALKNKGDGSNKEQTKVSHRCSVEGCRMRFKTKAELGLHKSNRCHVKGCGKNFSSHKYAVLHERVHLEDRPLKCPWKGCTMSFKWAWARTEHIRVHTGERPYKCKVDDCGLTFRFVSDFSRHRRKTGHNVN